MEMMQFVYNSLVNNSIDFRSFQGRDELNNGVGVGKVAKAISRFCQSVSTHWIYHHHHL